jgi:hypothetical protein
MSIKVTMGLEEETIKNIKRLFGFFKADNEASVIAGSIKLSNMIANEILHGSKILVEQPDGKLFQLVLTE